jgi:hypothetical protein
MPIKIHKPENKTPRAYIDSNGDLIVCVGRQGCEAICIEREGGDTYIAEWHPDEATKENSVFAGDSVTITF